MGESCREIAHEGEREIELRGEVAMLRQRNEELLRRAIDAEQALGAIAHGEVDAVTVEASATPLLVRAAQQALLHSEQRLRQSEAQFRAVIEKSTEFISLTSADGTTRYLTPSVFRLLGWTPEELGTRTLRDQVLPEDRDRIERELERLVRTGARDMSMEFRVRHRDGRIVWVESTGTNLLDDPDVRAIVGNYRDITARKRAEEALRASRDELEAAQAMAHVGSWVSGLEPDDEVQWTPECCRIFGLPPGTRITVASLFMAVPTEDRAELLRAEQAARERGIPVDLEHRVERPDGRPCWVHTRASVHAPVADAPARMVGTVQDITDRRLADGARAHLAAIVEFSEDAIIGTSLDATITSWNRGAEKLYGYRSDEAVGKPGVLILPTETQAEGRRVVERILQAGEFQQYEAERRRKDGSTVHVAVTISPIRDARGRLIGYSNISRDLTARRQMEATLRRTEDQFRQAQKMEAVGRLAGGVAHDFNNILSVILSYAALGLLDLKPGDPIREGMQEIQQAGRRATELTQQLLAFSRHQVLKPQVLDVNRVLSGMQRMLGRLLGEDIELSIMHGTDLGRVLADAGQIEQVVMNLAVNARDAMPGGGKLTLETANVELDAAYAGAHFGAVAGRYVLLAVSDNGSGMDEATQARVFEPFFTTKETGKGTGLGLATVFGIVKQSGGQIGLYSEVGRGTTFKIYLPRTDRVGEANRPSIPLAALGGSETILLVEDDVKVREVACMILRRGGYHVLETSNGGEAVLISREFGARVHLLLTDVVMPRMSGRQVLEHLAPERPDMKVLFASGYTDDAIVHHGVLDAGVPFLQKPFTPDALLRKVREVLDQVGPRSRMPAA